MNYFSRMPSKSVAERKLLLSFDGKFDTSLSEDTLPAGKEYITCNLTGANGALTECGGAEFYKIGNEYLEIAGGEITRAWYLDGAVAGSYLLYNSLNKRLYSKRQGDAPTLLANGEYTDPPYAVRYKLNDTLVLLIGSASRPLCVYDGESLREIENAPAITSMCVHYERLFGVSGIDNYLWFSDDLDPTNWNVSSEEAGYIEFADDLGKPLKIISFSDSVYVFRERGISRVSAYASQSDFAVTHLYVTGGRIYGDSVAVAGGLVMFLSEGGLYAFDGAETKRCCRFLDGILNGANDGAAAVFCNGNYYLAFRANFGDGGKMLCEKGDYVNNAVLRLNADDGTASLIRGADVKQFFTGSNDELLFCTVRCKGKTAAFTDSGKYFDEILPKYVRFSANTLGFPLSVKKLKYVCFKSEYPIEVIVTADKKVYRYYTDGSDTPVKIPVNVTGKVFSVEFFTEYKKVNLANGYIAYSVYGKEK